MSLTSPESRDRTASDSVALIAILLVAAAVRLVLWTGFQGKPLHDDEQDYNALAVNLVEHGVFGYHPDRPASLRPPLYSSGVAAIYKLCGLESHQAVRLAQNGLSLVNAIVLYWLGSLLFSRRAGLWLCGLYSFYPSLLGYNNLILTEVLFTLLLCGCCYLLSRSIKQSSISCLMSAGSLLGLSALTRSVLWLFPVVLVVFLLFAWRGGFFWKLVAVGSVLMSFCIVVAPWSVRNTRLEQTFTAIDTMGGRNLMMGNYEYTPLFRSWDAISLRGDEAWYTVLRTAYPESGMMTPGQKDKLAMRLGVRFVLHNPLLTAKRDIIKFFQFWGLERELVAGAARGYFGQASKLTVLLLTVLIFGSYCLTMIFGAFGMVMAPPQDKRLHILLLLVIAFICGMHTLVFAHSRYHLPVIPLVLAYSASALVHAREIWNRRREKSFWFATVICCVFIAGWIAEIGFVETDRFMNLMR
jgi:4-amino-4-deoxy-L-arabinose transferase-like glycosyltransferase